MHVYLFPGKYRDDVIFFYSKRGFDQKLNDSYAFSGVK